ncbi:MAG: sugar phosphate nucleotidyltransferase [Bacteroidota bacterium]
MHALVLAGGRGLRLAPYTRVLPKPLLPIGDRPVLAVLLERLRLGGVDHATIALGYLGDLIQTYLGDGRRFGMSLSYLTEKEPLGTAGPITLLATQTEPFLVVNGDILTDLPFGDLYQAHLDGGAVATVAACTYELQLDFGCLRTEGDKLVAWEEKPTWSSLVGIGAYVLSPRVQELCPGGRVEMPALIGRLLGDGHPVAVFVTGAYWRDIGLPEVYKAVNQNPPDFVRAGGGKENALEG